MKIDDPGHPEPTSGNASHSSNNKNNSHNKNLSHEEKLNSHASHNGAIHYQLIDKFNHHLPTNNHHGHALKLDPQAILWVDNYSLTDMKVGNFWKSGDVSYAELIFGKDTLLVSFESSLALKDASGKVYHLTDWVNHHNGDSASNQDEVVTYNVELQSHRSSGFNTDNEINDNNKDTTSVVSTESLISIVSNNITNAFVNFIIANNYDLTENNEFGTLNNLITFLMSVPQAGDDTPIILRNIDYTVAYNNASSSHNVLADIGGGAGLTIDRIIGADSSSVSSGDAGSVTTAQGGSVTMHSDGTFNYTPSNNFSGFDSFQFEVVNSSGQRATARISIDITPIANAITYTVADNSGVIAGQHHVITDAVNLGSGLTIDKILGATNANVSSGSPGSVITANGGMVTMHADGTFSYTPPNNFSGHDNFQYEIKDSSNQTTTATITFNVTPVANAITYTVADNAGMIAGQHHIISDAVNLGSGLTIDSVIGTTTAAVTGNTLLTAGSVTTANGGTVVMNANGTFSYTPANNFSGNDTFQYEVKDSSGQTSTATITIDVTPVANNTTYTVADNGSLLSGSHHVIADAIDLGSGLTIDSVIGTTTAAVTGNTLLTAGSVTTANGGTVVMNANGTFSYTPANNFSGNDTFQYEVKDSSGQTSTATITIDVTPVANNTTYTVADNGSLLSGSHHVIADAIDLGSGLTIDSVIGTTTAAVTGNTLLTAGSVTTANGGTVVMNANGTFSYTPANNFSGNDTFQYEVKDSSGQTSTATITIDVTPVANNTTYTVADNGSLLSGSHHVIADAIDLGSGLTIDSVIGTTTAAVTGNTLLTAGSVTTANGGTVVMNANGTFSYTPANNFSGNDTFQYEVKDSSGQTSTATITIDVTPVANNTTYTVADNGSLLSGSHHVIADAIDLGSGLTIDSVIGTTTAAVTGNTLLTAGSVTTANGGTVVMNANGTFSYTPANNFSGNDTFQYEVKDSSGQTSTATITIDVTPVANNTTYTVADNGSLLSGSHHVIADAIDLGSGLTIDSVIGTTTAAVTGNTLLTAGSVTTANGGTVVMNANGTFSYTPANNFSGNDTFQYEVKDSSGQTSTATITIDVTPVANNTTYTVASNAGIIAGQYNIITDAVDLGSGLSIDKVLGASNANVSSGTPGTVSTANGGSITMHDDGTFSYTPPNNFSGDDTFQYEIVDSSGQKTTATITVTVTPTPSINAPATQHANETTVNIAGGNLIFNSGNSNAITIGDGGSNITVTVDLSVAHGVINLSQETGLTITSGSEGSSAISFSGSLADINNALAGLAYTPTTNYTGNDSLSITATNANNVQTLGSVALTVEQDEFTLTGSNDTFHNNSTANGIFHATSATYSASDALTGNVENNTIEFTGGGVIDTIAANVSNIQNIALDNNNYTLTINSNSSITNIDATATNGKTITLNGSDNVAILAGNADTIDASSATGNITITGLAGGAGATLQGGAGDDTIQVDGQAFNPTGISGLQVWLDGSDVNGNHTSSVLTNGNAINAWHDKSGNGNDATAITAGRGGIYENNQANGFSGITFTGLSQMEINPSFSLGSTYSVFVIYSSTLTGGWSQPAIINTNNDWYIGSSFGQGYGSQGFATIGYTAGQVAGYNDFTQGGMAMGAMISNGSTTTVDINGVNYTTNGALNETVGNLLLGETLNGNNSLNGNIYEVLVYNTALSTSQQAQVNQYLAAKYGMSLTGTNNAVNTISGGAGADHFVWNPSSQSTHAAPDIVTDFNQNQGDKIDLSAFTGLTYIGNNNFDGIDNHVSWYQSGGNTFIDIDKEGAHSGSAIGDFEIELQGFVGTLTASDFIGVIDLTNAQHFTLTSGIDNFLGGPANDTVTGSLLNYSNSDTIRLGGGTNTFTLTDGNNGTNAVLGSNVSGVSTLILNNGDDYNLTLNNAGISSVDASAVDGSHSVTIDGSLQTSALTLTAGAGTTMLIGGMGANTITGGNGADTLVGGYSGHNTITGGTGNDTIYASGQSFDPTAFAGLQVWLDGSDVNGNHTSSLLTNGSTINTWHDKSGSGNDATAISAGRGALYETNQGNGYAGLSFAGLSQMEINPSFSLGSSYSVFVIYSSTLTGGWSQPAIINTNNDWYIGSSFGQGYGSQGFATIGYTAGQVAGYTDFTQGGMAIGAMISNGSTTTVDINGVNHTTSNGLNETVGNLLLGETLNGNNSLNGNIYEVLVYNTALNASQQAQVNNFLAAKYGLSLSGNGYVANTLTGNAGADHFVWTPASQSSHATTDVVTDFNQNQGDKIDLSGFMGLTYIGNNNFDGIDNRVSWYQSGGNTFIDIDKEGTHSGSAIGDFEIELQGFVGTLTASDFIGVTDLTSAQNFMLTSGADNFLGGSANDSVTGSLLNYSSNDIIRLGGGTNTFTLIDGANGADTIFGNNVSGISNLILTNGDNYHLTLNGAGISAIDASAVNSSYTVTIDGSNQTTGMTLTAGSGTTTLIGGMGADTIHGGSGTNILVGGYAGGNTIIGGTGNTTIYANGENFTPTDVGGLKVWLDASDANADGNVSSVANHATVNTWHDKSGQGNDATITAPGSGAEYLTNQANSHAGILFTGNSQLEINSNFSLGSNYSVFIIYNSTLTGGWSQAAITNTNNNWGVESSFGQGYGTHGFATLGYAGGNVAGYTDFNQGDMTVGALISDGNSTTVEINGVNHTTVGGIHQTVGNLLLGESLNGSNSLNGNIYEVLVYDSALNSSQQLAVNEYLAGKYGLSLSAASFAANTLSGGGDATHFTWSSNSHLGTGANADVVTNFDHAGASYNAAQGDSLDVSNFLGLSTHYIGNQAFTATGTLELRYSVSGSDSIIQMDINGDGVSDAEIKVEGITNLRYEDFNSTNLTDAAQHTTNITNNASASYTLGSADDIFTIDSSVLSANLIASSVTIDGDTGHNVLQLMTNNELLDLHGSINTNNVSITNIQGISLAANSQTLSINMNDVLAITDAKHTLFIDATGSGGTVNLDHGSGLGNIVADNGGNPVTVYGHTYYQYHNDSGAQTHVLIDSSITVHLT
jgi:hypothetical protein